MKHRNIVSICMCLMMILTIALAAACTPAPTTTPGTTAPTVIATNPGNVQNVSVGTTVSATFSEAMNPSTINSGTFNLKQGTTLVAGTVTYSGTTATFTPATGLQLCTTYTAAISTGVKNAAGTSIAREYVWNFYTSCAGAGPATGATAPVAGSSSGPVIGGGGGNRGFSTTITSTLPVDHATCVPFDSKIIANFAGAVTGVSFTLMQEGATPVAGTVSYTGSAAVFTPSAPLAPSANFTAKITAGTTTRVWNFTTCAGAETTPPTVRFTIPVGCVPTNSKITATFSEPMNAATINTGTFTLKQGATLIQGSVAYAGLTAIFTPSSPLTALTSYTATITTGVKDLAGNSMAANKTLTFTTCDGPDIKPPTVLFTIPIGCLPTNSIITATFSEPMNAATINTGTFTLKQGATLIGGSVNYDAYLTAVFTPSAPLANSTSYTATITTGVQDLAGNSMAADKTWTFTTCASPDSDAPTVSSHAPTATCEPQDSRVTATFSKLMNPLTITDTTFTVFNGATQVLGTVSYSGYTAMFVPSALLAAPATYTVTITTGAKDVAGHPLAAPYTWTFTTCGPTGPAPVFMGSLCGTSILANTTITNSGATTVSHDLDLYAGSEVTGAPVVGPPGVQHITDTVAALAQVDLTTAYGDAAGRTPPTITYIVPTDLGTLTLAPGIYKSTSSLGVTGILTLDGGGNTNSVFIFQTVSSLTTSGASEIKLINGALAKNVYWQVGSAAILGTNSIFNGTIMANTSITLMNGAALNGRALARTGAVNMEHNIVTTTCP